MSLFMKQQEATLNRISDSVNGIKSDCFINEIRQKSEASTFDNKSQYNKPERGRSITHHNHLDKFIEKSANRNRSESPNKKRRMDTDMMSEDADGTSILILVRKQNGLKLLKRIVIQNQLLQVGEIDLI